MHIGKKILLGAVTAAAIPFVAAADAFDGQSFLRQLQQRDSVLVADQLVYGFRIDGVEEGTEIVCPDFSKGFTEGVDVLGDWKLDTLNTHRAKNGAPKLYDIEGGIVLASFDEGEYVLDTICVMTAKEGSSFDTLRFEPSVLDVRTMPVDTATFRVHDIKGQIRYPVTFAEVLPWIIGVLAFAGLVAGIILLIRKFRKSKSEVRKKEPAHIIALRRLDKYRGDKMWVPEKQKAFYSGITDALREYISSRYGIGAMEMTTAGIFKEMESTDAPEALRNEVRELFERADYVKFAKYVASEQENSSALPLAVRFVTETYQAEIEAESTNEK